MQKKVSSHTFRQGLVGGIPIALGYIPVSFGFGILAAAGGLTPLIATIISLTNVTSAGQLAGLDILLAAGSLIEMMTAEFVINIRYGLMSISLTQKLDSTFGTFQRLLCGFAMTDEIFAVAYSQEGLIGTKYFYGLALLPLIGWNAGTLLGATAGDFLPASVQSAMGIVLYAMFLAIILPPATKDKAIAVCVCASALFSVALRVIPALSGISSGFAVVVCALAAALLASFLFPVKDETEGDGEA